MAGTLPKWCLIQPESEGEAGFVRLGTTWGKAARSHRGIAGIVVGLTGAGFAISAAFVGPSASAKGAVVAVPASMVSRLDALAIQVATANGDPRPAWITAVVTTHGKALESATPGDTEPTGNGVAVYLITMKGTFTDDQASRPSGSAAPRGHYLSIVINAKSLAVTDFGLSQRAPAVTPASLGPVRYLQP
jgi:hypothetical protein